MSAAYAQELLNSGIIHLKAGELQMARQFFERTIDATTDDRLLADAWFWLSEVTEDRAARHTMLESALSHNMHHLRARHELAVLDGKLNPGDVVDPDRLPSPQASEPVRINAHNFTCPNCGGRLAFAPDGQTLVCEHCGYKQAPDFSVQKPPEEQDFIVAMATEKGHRKPVLMHTFECENCGAEFLLPPAAISATCSYCGSTYVVDLNHNRDLIAPDGIIPLAFGQQQAARHFVDWVEQNKARPLEKAPPPRALYLPVWTFDVGGEIDYTGEIAGEKEIQIVHGSQAVLDNDIVIPATRKLGKLLSKTFPDYRLNEMLAYDPRYLVDWPAEVYQIAMGDASLEARSQAYQREKAALPDKFDPPLHNLLTSSANMMVDSYKLVLVPAWVTIYAAPDNRECTVLVNGQTGTVHGETAPSAAVPPDFKKLLDGLIGDK